jgi:hypothetical protein
MKTLALTILAVVLVGCDKTNHDASSQAPPSFSENDVREFVTPGRTIAEITNRFGHPSAVMTNNGQIVMWFSNPFMITTNEARPFGFSTSFTNGIVEKWEALQIKFTVTK